MRWATTSLAINNRYLDSSRQTPGDDGRGGMITRSPHWKAGIMESPALRGGETVHLHIVHLHIWIKRAVSTMRFVHQGGR